YPAVAVGGTVLGFGQVDSQIGFLALRKTVYNTKLGPVVADAGVRYLGTLDGKDRSALQPYGGLEVALASHLFLAAELGARVNRDDGQPMAVSLVDHGPGYQ